MSGRTRTAIRTAEVLVASPGRNFVTLRVVTEDGVIGLGDATLNGRELAVASYLTDHVVPLLTPSTSGRYDVEPAQRTPLPAEEDWDSRAYLRHIPGVLEAVRAEFGPELPLLHDRRHRP